MEFNSGFKGLITFGMDNTGKNMILTPWISFISVKLGVLILNDYCRNMLFYNVKTIHHLHVLGARNFSDKATATLWTHNQEWPVNLTVIWCFLFSICELTLLHVRGKKTTVIMLTIWGAILQNRCLGDWISGIFKPLI